MMAQWLLKLKRRLAVRSRERFARWARSPHYGRVRLWAGLAVGLVIVLLGSFIYPPAELFTPQEWPGEGDVAIEDLFAPIDFSIPKTLQEMGEERRKAEDNSPVILSYDRVAYDSVLRFVDDFFDRLDSLATQSLSPEAITRRLQRDFPWINLENAATHILQWPVLRGYMVDIFRGFYVVGVYPDRRYLPAAESKFVLVVQARREIPLRLGQIEDVEQARQSFLAEIMEAPGVEDSLRASLGEFAIQLIVANLEFDPKETNQRRRMAIDQIKSIKIRFYEGERIVRKNQRVTAEHVARLRALSQFMAEKARHENPLAFAVPIFARFVLIGLCVAGMGLYLAFFQAREIKRISSLLALGLIWAGTIIAAYAIWRTDITEYFIPIAVSSILVTVLFNLGMGVFSTVCLSVLLGVITGFDFSLTFVSLAVGIVTAYSIRRVHHRYDFYRPVLYGSITYVVLIYLLETLRFQEAGAILAACGIGVLNVFFSAILSIGLLPVFESLFGFTTDLTLLELSDLNHPLLRRLSIEAPGTYHHSLMIGSLCEGAAEAIGSNALLARVGAYYHDVGKIDKPEYFIENQTLFKSRHDRLSPTMSALILESHVKIGRELALEYDLPDPIIDFVEQHHGTTMMRFFLNKARQRSPESEIPDQEFRYPGPKPQSKETAILMLADSVEAVSRTLDSPKPSRLRAAIHKIVRDKSEAGQFDECDLTLRDLNLIEESFLKRLLGIFHKRVAYPEQQPEKAT